MSVVYAMIDLSQKGVITMTDFKYNLFEKLLLLSGESTIDFYLLTEDEGLKQLIKSGESQEKCLEYLNENY